MELASITIKQLFGKYDYKLDLTKRTTILVGANGVGKTTILKILYFISRNDFIQLRPYGFKEIVLEFVEDSQIKVIKRSDLFPSITSIKNGLIHMYKNDTRLIQDDLQKTGEFVSLEDWLGLLAELKRRDLFYSFLSDCYLSKNHSYNIVKVINRFHYFCSDENIASRIFGRILALIDQNLPFEDASLKKLNSALTENAFYIDMVQKYTISNRPTNEPAILSPLLKWFSLTDLEVIGTRRSVWDYLMSKRVSGSRWDPKLMLGHLAKLMNISSGDVYKELFCSIDDFQKKEFILEKVRSLLPNERHSEYAFLIPLIETSTIEINSLINKYYYSEEFIIDFNKRALQAYSQILNKGGLPYYQTDIEYDCFQQRMISFFSKPEVIENYLQYFSPILVEGNPFKFDIRELTLVIEHAAVFDERHQAFIKFYHEELPDLLDEKNKSAKILLFEELLKKYSQIKQIKTTPSGLFLQDISIVSTKHKHLNDHLTIEKSVDLGSISSGEKKIILLLALAIFVRDTVLLIDEPELSLSLVWQEQIIPDLINRTELNKIIVATHSPFIASDESLASSIVYLPQ